MFFYESLLYCTNNCPPNFGSFIIYHCHFLFIMFSLLCKWCSYLLFLEYKNGLNSLKIQWYNKWIPTGCFGLNCFCKWSEHALVYKSTSCYPKYSPILEMEASLKVKYQNTVPTKASITRFSKSLLFKIRCKITKSLSKQLLCVNWNTI